MRSARRWPTSCAGFVQKRTSEADPAAYPRRAALAVTEACFQLLPLGTIFAAVKIQYTTIGVVGIVIFFILAYFLGWSVAVGFLIVRQVFRPLALEDRTRVYPDLTIDDASSDTRRRAVSGRPNGDNQSPIVSTITRIALRRRTRPRWCEVCEG